MDTLLDWINSNEIEKLSDYIRSLKNINSILIYDEETDLNLLHIIAANDSPYRDRALCCILDESAKSIDKPKLDINRKSGPGNDCWTAVHLACCYGNLSTLQILLDNGSDPEILDKNGFDALDIATAFDQFRCVDLIRRKMKTFSKMDLNKSCDTVFYSIREPSLTNNNSFTVKKVDAQVQTSGNDQISHSSFDSTFKTTANNPSSVEPNELSTQRTDHTTNEKIIIHHNNSFYITNAIQSASKVLDRHRKEYETTKELNSTFIKEYVDQWDSRKSISDTAIMNEMRELVEKNKSIGRKCSKRGSRSNVIRNLRNSFKNGENKINSTDESIEPFDASISTISMGPNRELYIDNEFNVSLINETKSLGLISRLETDDSSELLSMMTNDVTIRDDKATDVKDGNTFSDCWSSTLIDFDSFDDDQLFEELTRLGHRPGPINANTRSVYVTKLKNLSKSTKSCGSTKLNNEMKTLNTCFNNITIDDQHDLMFSKPLRLLMTGQFDFKQARLIEIEFMTFFDNERASSKKYFNYLLLDPRITQDLCKKAFQDNAQFLDRLGNPSRAHSSTNDQSTILFNLSLFKQFLLAQVKPVSMAGQHV